LLKAFQTAANGGTLYDSVEYFNHINEILKESKLQALSVPELCNVEVFSKAFRYLAVRLMQEGATHLQQDISSGKSSSVAWNDNMVEIIEVVRAHINVYMLDTFVQTIQKVDDQPLKKILTQLCLLFALREMDKRVAQYVQVGFVQPQQIPLIKKAYLYLCKEIRQVAVPLVDALNVPDVVLNSPLGRYDGNIYQHYLSAVQQSRGNNEVIPYWNTMIKPRVTKRT